VCAALICFLIKSVVFSSGNDNDDKKRQTIMNEPKEKRKHTRTHTQCTGKEK
jgi:hypothetical protein